MLSFLTEPCFSFVPSVCGATESGLAADQAACDNVVGDAGKSLRMSAKREKTPLMSETYFSIQTKIKLI